MNPSNQPLRVLLIEDSEDDAFLLLRLLQRSGYEVTAERVESAAAMRSALARHKWDVIISDYVIPGFGGIEALALLRELELDIPFIMVSGQMGEETAVGAMKAGAHDYLRKDNLARLIPAIGRELRESEVRRARKDALEALRESEERFRQLAQNIDTAFFMFTLHSADAAHPQGVAYVSPAYETIWARSVEGLRKDPGTWVDSVQEVDLPRVRAALPGLARGEFNEQFRITRADGSWRWVHFRAFPVRNESGEIYRVAAIAEDITERKLAEQQLADQKAQLEKTVEVLRMVEGELRTNNAALLEARATLERRVRERTADLQAANTHLQKEITERKRLENELLEITEKERRRIGIDLHDDLGQHLNGMALLVEAMHLKLRQKELPEAADMERIKTVLHKTMNHAHGMARDLASVDQKGDDIAALLSGLAEQAEGLFNINCTVSTRGTIPSLEPDSIKQLYKIAQEAVTNAIKHGKAHKVEIELESAPECLELHVRNDGQPFPETLNMNTRMGLRIMNYRASLIGANLQIKGMGDEGTMVTCSMPYKCAMKKGDTQASETSAPECRMQGEPQQD